MDNQQELKNALEIKNLNFYYGSFQGLKNINLNIAERHVTAFIGPSGCGKSTLLRTLNRVYDLYPGQRAEGEINFYGMNILDPKQDLNLLRSRIGMVFQKPTPFPMTIYDNSIFARPVVLPQYAKASLPPPDINVRGWIYVPDDVGGAVPAFSDGLTWRRCTDRNVVS